MHSPRASSAFRLLFLALALVLAAAVAALGVFGFARQVDSFQVLGFEAEARGAAWEVVRVSHPSTGLRTGDEILLVAGQPAGERARLEELLRAQPASELLVRRGDGLESLAYARPSAEIDGAYLILAALGLAYLLIGLYTVWKDRRQEARVFYVWSLASAAFFLLSPLWPPQDGGDRLLYAVDQAARTILPALTLHLFLVFPTRLFDRAWLRPLLVVAYLPSLALGALHLGQLVRGTVDWKLQLVQQLELYLWVVSSLAAALALVVRLARDPEWEERRQVQWIFFGLVGGVVPFLILYLVPFSLGFAVPSWLSAAAVLPLALLPLAFTLAIFRYRLLDAGLILRNSISYALTAIVGVAGFAVLHLMIQSGLSEELRVARSILTFAAGLAVAGVLAPTRSAISAGLEHLQYRGSLAQRRRLRELGHELLHERDLDRLCGALRESLEEGLETRATLYLMQGGAMVPLEPDPGLPRQLAPDALGGSFWERDSIALSAIALPAAEVAPQLRLYAAGYRYAFPLTVREHRIGAALIGYRQGEEPLTSEDLDLARGLLDQAALAIENARLLEEVHRKLEEVVRLEAYSQGILDSSPAGIAVVDRKGTVQSANHAFAAIAGVARPELRGRAIEELLPVRPLPAPEDGLIEVSFCLLSGEERHLQLSTARYRAEDDLRIVIVQDVSERVAIELELKEKERLAALGMLAAGVAHEVNTPLTGISSYAQLLLSDTDESHPQYSMLKKMERQSFRASQIVNNLLAFARNRREEPAPVAVDAVVAECLQMLAERAQAAGVAIRFERPPAPLRVSGHEGELLQVFTNLVTNALDAMTPGGGRLEVALEDDGERVRVAVVDSGRGIPPAQLETIFRPFFTSKTATARSVAGQGGAGSGTGLGLAITDNIVRRHGGEVYAENNPDGGSTFTVSLPRLGAACR